MSKSVYKATDDYVDGTDVRIESAYINIIKNLNNTEVKIYYDDKIYTGLIKKSNGAKYEYDETLNYLYEFRESVEQNVSYKMPYGLKGFSIKYDNDKDVLKIVIKYKYSWPLVIELYNEVDKETKLADEKVVVKTIVNGNMMWLYRTLYEVSKVKLELVV